jgi:hypothetical protein
MKLRTLIALASLLHCECVLTILTLVTLLALLKFCPLQVFEDRRMGSVTARVADLCDEKASQKYFIRHESNSSRDGELKSRDSTILFDPHVFTAKPKFAAPPPGSGTSCSEQHRTSTRQPHMDTNSDSITHAPPP